MIDEQTNKEKAVFRLCAIPTTAEETAEIEGQRFSRITADYTLIYTADEPVPEDWVILTDEDAGRLTVEDRRWLNDCNAALIAEEAARQKPRIIRLLAELLDNIERNIAESTEEGGRTDDGE